MNQAFCPAYEHRYESEKLQQLRAKTDQQLLEFVHSKLQTGLNLAALARTGHAAAKRWRGRAEEALVEAQKLLPALNEEQRRELNVTVKELQDALTEVSALERV
jgi:hypothetical protein